MTFFHDTPENIAALAGAFGMPPIVAQGWLRNEGQEVDNPTNPLNIMRTFVPTNGYTPGGYAIFASPAAGLAAAYQIIKNVAAAGYAQLLLLRGSPDAAAWAKAIERSSWAGGRYHSDWPHGVPGSISAFVAAHTQPAGTQAGGGSHVAPVQTLVSSLVQEGTVQGTTEKPVRRFVAATLAEADPLTDGASHLLAFDAEIFVGGSDTPHGHFLRTSGTPPVLIAKSDVTLVASTVTVPPAPTDPYAGLAPLSTNEAIVAFEAQPGIAAQIDAAYARFLTALTAYQAAHGQAPGDAEPQSVMIAIAASVNASILRYVGEFGAEDNTFSR